MHFSTRAPVGARTLLAVALAAAIAAPSSAVAEAPSGPAPQGSVKTRAVEALVRGAHHTTARAASRGPSLSTSARTQAEKGSTRDPGLSHGPTAQQRTNAAVSAATPTCDAVDVQATPSHDHVWLHWNASGATTFTVVRQRLDGAATYLATTGSTSFRDLTVNPDGFVTYRVAGSGGGVQFSCPLPGFVTMSTDDGKGVPDAVYGGASADGTGTGALMEQDGSSFAMPTGLNGSDPAYSPDGRRVAAVVLDAGGAWTLTVVDQHRPSLGALATLAMTDGTVAYDTAWSPDGTQIAYTRYTVDAATQDVTGSSLHVWTPATGADREISGSTDLIQPEWLDGSKLVATGIADEDGLSRIPAAGGSPVPIAGTQYAAYPTYTDHRIWFTSFDGTTGRIGAVIEQANDQVSYMRENTTHRYEQLRAIDASTFYVVDVDRKDLTTEDDDTWTVQVTTTGFSGSTSPTAIGSPLDESLQGFSGFDVRAPRSKGTSDFVGDGGPDIIARDTAGVLWAYPSTPDALAGPRVRIGSGWSVYDTYLAAGDLNGDDRADLVARDKNGLLWRYDGLGNGAFRPRVRMSSGWTGYLPVAVGDWDGDRRADIVARDSAGALWLYPGTGTGLLAPRRKIGTGWQGLNAIVGSGDFDFDGAADLLAREASTGKLWLYPGNGSGGFRARRQVGSGWQVFSGIAGPEFVGANPMVYARRTTGEMYAYRVLGDGRFASNEVYYVGSGWRAYSFTS